MHVAIIEDERRLAASIKKGLELEGIAADTFLNAESAKKQLSSSRNRYDLIILDLMLPDEDGAEVCSDLQTTGVTTPILVLTARDSTEDKIDLFNRGADDFLTKPFEFGELIARGNALVRRASPEMPQTLEINDVQVYPSKRMVLRKGKEVVLTEREFDLLAYLMRRAGSVVSRDELYAKAWHQSRTLETNTVDVHVRNVRKKLKDTKGVFIQTIHGIGYTITRAT